MKWAVEIERSALTRRNVADLMTSLGFSTNDGESVQILTSPEIDACTSPDEVFEIAKRIRDAFVGSAAIDPTFELGAVIDHSANPAKRYFFLEIHSAMHLHTSSDVVLSISPPSDLGDSEKQAWLDQRSESEYRAKFERQAARLVAAFRSERAAKVMDLLSNPVSTGDSLYKAYELMEGNPKTDRTAFHREFSISKAQFDRFKDAVHNPAVSGEWARHAYEDVPKTENPMSRTEAEAFVRKIADDWLRTFRSI